MDSEFKPGDIVQVDPAAPSARAGSLGIIPSDAASVYWLARSSWAIPVQFIPVDGPPILINNKKHLRIIGHINE